MKMNSLNLLKKYLIDSQIFVSVMGTFFAVFFMVEQDIIKTPTIALIFITYFSGYLYTKYQNTRKFFTKILNFNLLSGIISVALIIYNHNEYRLLKWFIIVILGLLYDSTFSEIFRPENSAFQSFLCGFNLGIDQLLADFTGI